MNPTCTDRTTNTQGTPSYLPIVLNLKHQFAILWTVIQRATKFVVHVFRQTVCVERSPASARLGRSSPTSDVIPYSPTLTLAVPAYMKLRTGGNLLAGHHVSCPWLLLLVQPLCSPFETWNLFSWRLSCLRLSGEKLLLDPFNPPFKCSHLCPRGLPCLLLYHSDLSRPASSVSARERNDLGKKKSGVFIFPTMFPFSEHV